MQTTVGFTAATAIALVLLLNTSVFAFSAGTAGAQASPSPLDGEHESSSTHTSTQSSAHTSFTTTVFSTTKTSTHTSTQESTQTEDDQNGNNNGNGNDEAGNQNGENEGGALHFTLYSPSSTNNGKDDRGQASIVIKGNSLDIEISVKKTSPSTTFSVMLVAIPIPTTTSTTTSTTTVFSTTKFSTTTTITSTASASCTGSSIGTFVTGGDGEGEAELSTTLNSGTYALGLVLCSKNLPVLVSHPATIKAVVPQSAEGKDEDSDDETTSTTTMFSTTMTGTTVFSTSTGKHDDRGDEVNPVTKGGHDDDAIRAAMSDRTIPAVIGVFNSGVTLNQLDSRFSVAASKLEGNGLMISISAQNVTGSRVLLVNLTGSQWSTSSLQSLKVMFDGAPISQAASLSQVLNSTSADPASYIIMLASSGLQLLISIPHFSLHTIQLIPTAAPTAGVGSLNGALLVGAIILLSALSVAVYLKRGKVNPFLGVAASRLWRRS